MSLSFAELQRQLRPEWGEFHPGSDQTHGREGNSEGWDLLVVPSLSLDHHQIALVTGAHHYEERQLFSLIRLRDPGVRAVYLTSKLLPELVVDAVLELLPGVPASHARRRLHLFDTDDASARSLTEKLLERPALLGRIRERLRPGRSFMTCFNVTEQEKRLSERLQVPLLGTDPALMHWGGKAGSRELFRRCDVPHPPGSPLVHDLEALADATAELWEAHPELSRVVVKLDQGFSGEGNAPLELEPLQLEQLSGRERRASLREALETLAMPPPQWRQLLQEQGALVEAWLQGGEELASPSVQGMIHPGGAVEVLSTHEQVLGGVSGQTYLGCRFPAEQTYRAELMRHGLAVGQALAAEGALERYAVDFVARRFGDRWDLQAIEVNLRKGGTTHPYMALRYATNGRIDAASGLFRSPTGQPLYYAATDNLCDPRLRGLLPVDLIDLVAAAGLHFDPAELHGSVFHLLGCLSEFGKLGMTCIGRSPEEAGRIYAATAERLIAGAEGLRG
ncbi:carboxylate-amine ligase [Synechococcus sp. BSF8S]|uniref:peptide ligase PGM1-related protein n=1 Tax=Synechococcales TaxID=1890424 RepID=UPI001623B0DB|nr:MULTISPECIES: peptide ligase PGM1-related protein [unclassified Synechococcus]MBC1260553.1 carboxylate-amine ligase [Synechococcus sp. BSF8S]MBC1263204.1 carboxylate-amine ligase [Synechococcus sp. BSA11S]